MAIRTELSLRLPNSPGALARVCQALSGEHVNILALSIEPNGVLRMVVDNHVHAAGVLRDQQYDVEERDALFVQMPNNAGAFVAVARLLADAGINVDYVYGSALEGEAMATIVVGVEAAERAAAAAGL